MAVDPEGPIRRPGSAAAASETKRGPRHASGPRRRRSSKPGEASGGRSGGQRTILALGGVACALVLIVAGALSYFNWRLGQINRVDLDLANAPAGGPQNYLIVGSDSRKGISAKNPESGAFLNDSQYAKDPDGGGRRSDTIMILRIDPKQQSAKLLSLPRDLYVPIAGTDKSDKINSAFSIGVTTLIQTIQDAFDIPINHYVEVDFVGFRELVDAMGGVSLYFDKPMWDSHTGLNVSAVGCHDLDGDQALAFARSRYLWYNTLGKSSVDTSSLRYLDESQMEANGWQQDGTSDLGRISRQQLLIRTAIPQAERAGFKSPATLNSIMKSAVDSLTVDDGLSTGNLLALANRFRHFNPDDLVTYSYPATPGHSTTSGSILEPDEQAAERILDNFRSTPGPPESHVDVRVLNASGVNRQAANVAGALERVGFEVDSTADASTEGIGQLARTQVRYAIGSEDQAKLVAEHLSTPVELVPIQGASSDVVEVVTGADFTTVTTQRRKLDSSELPPKQTTTTTGSTTSKPSASTTTVVGIIPDQTDRSCT